MNEEIRKRDALWCQALIDGELTPVQIEKVARAFSRLRDEAVEHSVAANGAESVVIKNTRPYRPRYKWYVPPRR
jgi:hypothetical protein